MKSLTQIYSRISMPKLETWADKIPQNFKMVWKSMELSEIEKLPDLLQANNFHYLMDISVKDANQFHYKICDELCSRDKLNELAPNDIFKIITSFKAFKPHKETFYRLEPYILKYLGSFHPN